MGKLFFFNQLVVKYIEIKLNYRGVTPLFTSCIKKCYHFSLSCSLEEL